MTSKSTAQARHPRKKNGNVADDAAHYRMRSMILEKKLDETIELLHIWQTKAHGYRLRWELSEQRRERRGPDSKRTGN